MKRNEKINLWAFLIILILVIFWIRYNLDFMRPILESSLLFFQLMIGVLVIAIIRNIIGIKTYGVFGPVIIIFGILKSDLGLFMGLIIFVNIFLVAMLISQVLYPLRISSSYRVAIIISSVVTFITVFELVGELFHLRIFEAAIFFPVLITSWFADRFIVQVKEIDWIETSKKLFGTFLAIVAVYYVITIEIFISFVSVNPETWILLIGVNFYLALKSNMRIMDNFRFKKLFKKLKNKDSVISLNVRNRDYIARYNPAKLFSALDKDEMKLSLHQLGIPTTETYLIIGENKDLSLFEDIVKDKKSFVIKPAKGLGGEGILVVDKKGPDYFVRGKKISFSEIKSHINQILEGQFSSDFDDKAIIEEKIIVSKYFSDAIGNGVFDIRVIVFFGFPILSMMRIPTEESRGLANIHKGAISMGLDIATGKGVNPQWKSHGGDTKFHPDTKFELTKLKISNWDEILRISCLAQGASKLNYVGVDISISKDGPLVLEVNKRPGLEIQNANSEGLLKRLKFVEKRLSEIKFKSIEERIRLVKVFDFGGWK